MVLVCNVISEVHVIKGSCDQVSCLGAAHVKSLPSQVWWQ